MNERGFTLVEVILTSLISTVLAMAMFSLLYVNTTEMQESIADMRLAHRYSVVLEEMQRLTRKAHFVKTYEYDDPLLSAPADTLQKTGIHQVTLCNSAGASIGGFRIFTVSTVPLVGYLEEHNGTTWIPFRVGADTAWLIPDPLRILPGRRGIAFNIKLIEYEGGTITHQLMSTREVIRCRNGYY